MKIKEGYKKKDDGQSGNITGVKQKLLCKSDSLFYNLKLKD
jgi:hypothetical protein